MKKVFIALLSAVVGAIAGASYILKITSGEKAKEKELSTKHFALFQLMNRWVEVKQEGKNLSIYFEKNGYKKIAIYGMSYVGRTLVEELKNSGVNVAYGIDKRADSFNSEVDIITLDEELEEVDAIVVTAITFFDEIADTLEAKVDCPIINLEDLLYEV